MRQQNQAYHLYGIIYLDEKYYFIAPNTSWWNLTSSIDWINGLMDWINWKYNKLSLTEVGAALEFRSISNKHLFWKSNVCLYSKKYLHIQIYLFTLSVGGWLK